MFFYSDILVGIEKYAGSNILIKDVTVEWLKKLEGYLSRDKSPTTVGMYMRAIRTIMNLARQEGLLRSDRYPFGKGRYEIKVVQGRKKALSSGQIAQIAQYDDGNLTSQRYRDIWFFMYLCNGINMADLVRLRYRDIIDGEICFIRQKTARTAVMVKEIRVAITAPMQEIIDRWGSEKKPNNVIFPLIGQIDDAMRYKLAVKNATKCINNRMKMIGNALGMGSVTTYTARHTYATMLKRQGVNIAYISESLGHSSLKTTENYLASFEKDDRLKNAALLTAFEVAGTY